MKTRLMVLVTAAGTYGPRAELVRPGGGYRWDARDIRAIYRVPDPHSRPRIKRFSYAGNEHESLRKARAWLREVGAEEVTS